MALSVENDHLEAKVDGNDDVRAVNDQVRNPWENDKGEVTAALMPARWGRTETKAEMDLELVPEKANGDRFTLLFKGQPLADNDVMLITPKNKAQQLKTDDKGLVELTLDAPGPLHSCRRARDRCRWPERGRTEGGTPLSWHHH